jgi:serine protease inhibitor
MFSAENLSKMLVVFRLAPILGVLFFFPEVAESSIATSSDRPNTFGIEVLNKLAGNGSDNAVISPFSLELALGMVYIGGTGVTARELSKAVGFGPPDASPLFPGMGLLSQMPSKVILKIANSLWCDDSAHLRTSYVGDVKARFGAEVNSVKLPTDAAMHRINDWVATATDHKITDLLQQPPQPPLVLIDAVYFKGAWEYPFSKQNDFPGIFHREDGSTCETTMMKQSLSAPYLETDNFQAIQLGYIESRLGMVLVLPLPGTSVGAVLQGFKVNSWNETLDRFASRNGTVVLPRFKITYRSSLVKVLPTLGLRALFEPSRDFAGIFNDPRKFYVSDILQETFLRVDEEGSEAAAATGVQMRATAMRPIKPFELTFDRPFLFAIVDNKSGQMLFVGLLRDPDKAKL